MKLKYRTSFNGKLILQISNATDDNGHAVHFRDATFKDLQDLYLSTIEAAQEEAEVVAIPEGDKIIEGFSAK